MSFILESPGWGPGWGCSHSAQWSWVLRSAGRSTGKQCVLLCSPSPLVAGHVYLQQACDILFVNNWLSAYSVFVISLQNENNKKKSNEVNTNSALHWCWSAPWPLTSVCWLPWSAAMSCSPCQPVSLSQPSPQGTGLAHLRAGRQDSEQDLWTVAQLHSCSFNRWGQESWQTLTQKFVDIILL